MQCIYICCAWTPIRVLSTRTVWGMQTYTRVYIHMHMINILHIFVFVLCFFQGVMDDLQDQHDQEERPSFQKNNKSTRPFSRRKMFGGTK